MNYYVANSKFIARRIRKVYGREAEVIHPPVDVPAFLVPADKGDFYFAASRLVPYKNIAAIVEAFRELPDRKLVVAGAGPDLERIRALAGGNVEIRGFVEDAEMRQLMRKARAYIFAAEEDFGIMPVEAQGEGTPVIALGRGGARETVVPPDAPSGEAPTGLYFDRPIPALIADAVRRFELIEAGLSREACHRNALRFSTARFEAQFAATVTRALGEFQADINGGPQKRLLQAITQAEAA